MKKVCFFLATFFADCRNAYNEEMKPSSNSKKMFVIPAQVVFARAKTPGTINWIPAFAGMTKIQKDLRLMAPSVIRPNISSVSSPTTPVNHPEIVNTENSQVVTPVTRPEARPEANPVASTSAPASIVARTLPSEAEQRSLREFVRERETFISTHLQGRDKQEAILMLIPSLVELGDVAKIQQLLESFTHDLQALPVAQSLQLRQQLVTALQGSPLATSMVSDASAQITRVLREPSHGVTERAQDLMAAIQFLSQTNSSPELQGQAMNQILELRTQLYPEASSTTASAETSLAFLQLDHFISQNETLKQRLENDTLASIDFLTARTVVTSEVPGHEKDISDLGHEMATATAHTVLSIGSWLRNKLSPSEVAARRTQVTQILDRQRRIVAAHALEAVRSMDHLASPQELRTLALSSNHLSQEGQAQLRTLVRAYAQNSLTRDLFRQEFRGVSNSVYSRLSEQVVNDFEAYLLSGSDASRREHVTAFDTISADSFFRQTLIAHQLSPSTRASCWTTQNLQRASQALQIFASFGLQNAVRDLGAKVSEQLANRRPTLADARRYRELAQTYSRAGMTTEALSTLDALAVLCESAGNRGRGRISADDQRALTELAQVIPVFRMQARELNAERLDQISSRLDAIVAHHPENSLAVELQTQVNSQRATLRSATLLRVLDSVLNHQVGIWTSEGAASAQDLNAEKDLFIQEISRLTAAESTNRLTVAQAIQTLLGSANGSRFSHLQEFFAHPTQASEFNIEESLNHLMGREDAASASSIGQLTLNFINANSLASLSSGEVNAHLESFAFNLSHSRFNAAQISLSLCSLLRENGASAEHITTLQSEFNQRAQMNGVLFSASEMLPIHGEASLWSNASFLLPFMFGGLSSARIGASLGGRLLCMLAMKAGEAAVFVGLETVIGAAQAYRKSIHDPAHHRLAFQNWRNENLGFYNLSKKYLSNLVMFLACHGHSVAFGSRIIKPLRSSAVTLIDRSAFSAFAKGGVLRISEMGLGGSNFVGSTLGGFLTADKVQEAIGLREHEEIADEGTWLAGKALEAFHMDLAGRLTSVGALGRLKHSWEATLQMKEKLPRYGNLFRDLNIDPLSSDGSRVLSILHSIERGSVQAYRQEMHLDIYEALNPEQAGAVLTSRIREIEAAYARAATNALHETSVAERTRLVAEALEYQARGHSLERLLEQSERLEFLSEEERVRLVSRSMNAGMPIHYFERIHSYLRDFSITEAREIFNRVGSALINTSTKLNLTASQLRRLESFVGMLNNIDTLHEHLTSVATLGASHRQNARVATKRELLSMALREKLTANDIRDLAARHQDNQVEVVFERDEVRFVDIPSPRGEGARREDEGRVHLVERSLHSDVNLNAVNSNTVSSNLVSANSEALTSPQPSPQGEGVVTTVRSRTQLLGDRAVAAAGRVMMGAAGVVGVFGLSHFINPSQAQAQNLHPQAAPVAHTALDFISQAGHFLTQHNVMANLAILALVAGGSYLFNKVRLKDRPTRSNKKWNDRGTKINTALATIHATAVLGIPFFGELSALISGGASSVVAGEYKWFSRLSVLVGSALLTTKVTLLGESFSQNIHQVLSLGLGLASGAGLSSWVKNRLADTERLYFWQHKKTRQEHMNTHQVAREAGEALRVVRGDEKLAVDAQDKTWNVVSRDEAGKVIHDTQDAHPESFVRMGILEGKSGLLDANLYMHRNLDMPALAAALEGFLSTMPMATLYNFIRRSAPSLLSKNPNAPELQGIRELLVKKFNIAHDERFVWEGIETFNDFFTRALVVPRDGLPLKLGQAYHDGQLDWVARGRDILDKGMRLINKGIATAENPEGVLHLPLRDILGKATADLFEGKHLTALAIYLSPRHYHQTLCPAEGIVEKVEVIDGARQTVDPILRNSNHLENLDGKPGANFQTENHRVVITIKTEKHGRVALVCTSAAMVSTSRLFARVGTKVNVGELIHEYRFGSHNTLVFESEHFALAHDLVPQSEVYVAGTEPRNADGSLKDTKGITELFVARDHLRQEQEQQRLTDEEIAIKHPPLSAPTSSGVQAKLRLLPPVSAIPLALGLGLIAKDAAAHPLQLLAQQSASLIVARDELRTPRSASLTDLVAMQMPSPASLIGAAVAVMATAGVFAAGYTFWHSSTGQRYRQAWADVSKRDSLRRNLIKGDLYVQSFVETGAGMPRHADLGNPFENLAAGQKRSIYFDPKTGLPTTQESAGVKSLFEIWKTTEGLFVQGVEGKVYQFTLREKRRTEIGAHQAALVYVRLPSGEIQSKELFEFSVQIPEATLTFLISAAKQVQDAANVVAPGSESLQPAVREVENKEERPSRPNNRRNYARLDLDKGIPELARTFVDTPPAAPPAVTLVDAKDFRRDSNPTFIELDPAVWAAPRAATNKNGPARFNTKTGIFEAEARAEARTVVYLSPRERQLTVGEMDATGVIERDEHGHARVSTVPRAIEAGRKKGPGGGALSVALFSAGAVTLFGNSAHAMSIGERIHENAGAIVVSALAVISAGILGARFLSKKIGGRLNDVQALFRENRESNFEFAEMSIGFNLFKPKVGTLPLDALAIRSDELAIGKELTLYHENYFNNESVLVDRITTRPENRTASEALLTLARDNRGIYVREAKVTMLGEEGAYKGGTFGRKYINENSKTPLVIQSEKYPDQILTLNFSFTEAAKNTKVGPAAVALAILGASSLFSRPAEAAPLHQIIQDHAVLATAGVLAIIGAGVLLFRHFSARLKSTVEDIQSFALKPAAFDFKGLDIRSEIVVEGEAPVTLEPLSLLQINAGERKTLYLEKLGNDTVRFTFEPSSKNSDVAEPLFNLSRDEKGIYLSRRAQTVSVGGKVLTGRTYLETHAANPFEFRSESLNKGANYRLELKLRTHRADVVSRTKTNVGLGSIIGILGLGAASHVGLEYYFSRHTGLSQAGFGLDILGVIAATVSSGVKIFIKGPLPKGGLPAAIFKEMGKGVNLDAKIPAQVTHLSTPLLEPVQAPRSVEELELMMQAKGVPAKSLAFLRGRLLEVNRIPDESIRAQAAEALISMAQNLHERQNNADLNTLLQNIPEIDYTVLNTNAEMLNKTFDAVAQGQGRDYVRLLAFERLRSEVKGKSVEEIHEAFRKEGFYLPEQSLAMQENPHALNYKDYMIVLGHPDLHKQESVLRLRSAVEKFYDSVEALRQKNGEKAAKAEKRTALEEFEESLEKLERNGHSERPLSDYELVMKEFQAAMRHFFEEDPSNACALQIAQMRLFLLRKSLRGMKPETLGNYLEARRDEVTPNRYSLERGQDLIEAQNNLRRTIRHLTAAAQKMDAAAKKNRSDVDAFGVYERSLVELINKSDRALWADLFNNIKDTDYAPARAALRDYYSNKHEWSESLATGFETHRALNDKFNAEQDLFSHQMAVRDLQLQHLQIRGYFPKLSEAAQREMRDSSLHLDALIARLDTLDIKKVDALRYNRLLEAALKAVEQLRKQSLKQLAESDTAFKSFHSVSVLFHLYTEKLEKMRMLSKVSRALLGTWGINNLFLNVLKLDRLVTQKLPIPSKDVGNVLRETEEALGPVARTFARLIPLISRADEVSAANSVYLKLGSTQVDNIIEANDVAVRRPASYEGIAAWVQGNRVQVMKHSSWWDFISTAIHALHRTDGMFGNILGKDGLMDLLPAPVARVLKPYMTPVGARPEAYEAAIGAVAEMMAAQSYPVNVFDELTMAVSAPALGYLGTRPAPVMSAVLPFPKGGRSFVVMERFLALTGEMPWQDISVPLGAWARMPKPDDFKIHHPGQIIVESVSLPLTVLRRPGSEAAHNGSAANWVRTLMLRMALNPQGWPVQNNSHDSTLVHPFTRPAETGVEAQLRDLPFYPSRESVAAEEARLNNSTEATSLRAAALEQNRSLLETLEPVSLAIAAQNGSSGLGKVLKAIGLGAVLMMQGCESNTSATGTNVAVAAVLLGVAVLARKVFRGNNAKTQNVQLPIGKSLSAEELPESLQNWAGVRGSGFVWHETVKDSRELATAIVKNLQSVLGENATQITGYGSFPLFTKGKNEAIHLRDADKKPDYILIVRDTHEAIAALGRQWNWSAEKIAEMQEHARFSPEGHHQGFTFFNSDILVPELGPVGFKFSLISEEAFYHCNAQGRPNLEYAQIRLKDHNPEFALLHSTDRERFINHLQAIRVAMCEDALIHLDNRKSFSGADLGVEFFNASYRREGYRFWEWTKGADLFETRKNLVPHLLLESYREVATRYELKIELNGQVIQPHQLNETNLYEVQFSKTKVLNLPRMSPAEYLNFLSRGFWSYIKHGLPGNRVGGAYYIQPNDQYAGRKYRAKLKDKATGQYRQITHRDSKLLVQAWILSHPVMRQIPGLGPIFRLAGMDTWRVPLYYPDMEVFINELHGNTESPFHLDQAEHRLLSQYFAANPSLLYRQNAALLMPLVEMVAGNHEVARSAAIKLLAHLGSSLPLQEASIRGLMELVKPGALSVTIAAKNVVEKVIMSAALVYPFVKLISGYEIKLAQQTDAIERAVWQNALDFCTAQRLSVRLLELNSRLAQELRTQNEIDPVIRKSLRRFQRIVQSNQKLLTSVHSKLEKSIELTRTEKSFLNKAGAVLAGRQVIEGRDHILEQLDWYFRTQDQGSDFNQGLIEKQNAYYELIEGWNERRKNPDNIEASQLHVSEDPRHDKLYNEYRIALETLLNLNGALPEHFEGDLFRDITFRREGNTTIIEPRGWKPSNEYSVRRLWRFLIDDTKSGSAGAAFKLFDLVSPEHHQRAYNMVHGSWLYRAMARNEIKVVLHGTENLTNASRPAVILPTHDSGLEFSAILNLMHDYDYFAYYMADEKFLRPPMSNLLRGMKEMGHFFVNRKNRASALQSMVDAGHVIGTTNKSMIVFPGATRNPIRYNAQGERFEGPIYGAKPGSLATLDAANEHRPTVGIPMGLVGGGIIYSKETFRSMFKEGAGVGRVYHVHMGTPIRPESLEGPNGERTPDARRRAFTQEIDRQFHEMTGRPIAPPAASKDKKAKKGGSGTPPAAGISGLSLLTMGAMSTFLTGFTNTESLALKAVALGVFVSVAGKEVCDRYLWPRLRQSFVDKAQARNVDVSHIDVSGQALAPLSEILRQAKIDFKANPKILIPNALTASAIVSALGACVASIAHRPLLTVLGLGLAPFLDGIDGAVARKLGASSRTGELADDFADNINNGAIVGTLAAAHLANLGQPVLGVMVAAAFTVAIRTRLSVFRLISDNPALKPKVDPLGNPHYQPIVLENGKEISTGFLGVASPVAAMSVLGLYSSVQNSPNLFFGGCMLTAFSLVDWMARGKIGKEGLSARRAAAYSIPGMILSAIHLATDTPMSLLPGTVDFLSGGVASFTTAYIADPYVRALLRKIPKAQAVGEGFPNFRRKSSGHPFGNIGE